MIVHGVERDVCMDIGPEIDEALLAWLIHQRRES